MDGVGWAVPVPLDLGSWRVLYNAVPCESCATFVALVQAYIGEDPITAVPQWIEIVAWPDFGTEHTPERCRAVRGR